MLGVLLTAPFLSLDNFAAATALGLRGVGWTTRASTVFLFGIFAAVAIGLGGKLGAASANWLGPLAQYVGGFMLMSLGAYQLWREHDLGRRANAVETSNWSLLTVAIGVSLDTVVAGAAFGLRGDPIFASAAVVGTVTASLTLIGLQFGGWLRNWSRQLSPRVAPSVLVCVGIGMATGIL